MRNERIVKREREREREGEREGKRESKNKKISRYQTFIDCQNTLKLNLCRCINF